ncbi:alpha/beta fold hydrolase [Nocardia cerradoensis]|uniref:Soluble epoxide hydrolase n=1 Tax=Nocardia cerradoensis TaxID=85688 RepID=A0A231HG49_9NOCA|nr:alpha/beta hydrolase [Nocardia cerradoensis]NKY43814.1 alpha/beta hydrolase [Nocardia cerradoensis]OXR47852.1 Soluble epoxide hydrolase [Nocardia cerradoensis]
MGTELRFGYADTSFGQLHYAEQGEGPTLLLLHQTPRSWDEFRELMPLLAGEYRVLAMDMVGFGASAKLPAPQTIELYARGACELLDALGVQHAAVLGHHTGAAVALEMAVTAGERVVALLLSSCPWTDERYRGNHAAAGGVDRAERNESGTHLRTLWDLRRPYYPAPVAGLLDRFIRDALAFGVDPAEGHRACARYRMEDRIGAVTAPVLLIGAEKDPFSMPNLPVLSDRLVAARSVRRAVVDNGTVALLEREASAVASVVRDFLASAEITWPDVNTVEPVH